MLRRKSREAHGDRSCATPPYNHELLSWLDREHRAGRSIWLCTGANVRTADPIARHLKLFSGVFASDCAPTSMGRAAPADSWEEFGYRESRLLRL